MDAILLAAGYATRLYPLTRDRAKPLLPVGGRPIVDYLVDRLEAAPEIERLFLVTNARFAEQFADWASERTFAKPMRTLNDGSTCNDDRLGAVGDMRFVLDETDAGHDGAYVLATDNMPRFDLIDIATAARERRASAVFACPVADEAQLHRVGVAELDEDGRIVGFEEKPEHPRSNLRVPPFYAYTADAFGLVPEYLAGGGNPDAPGNFLAWLIHHRPVYATVCQEGTYDIGTLDSYHQVLREFEGQPRNAPGS